MIIEQIFSPNPTFKKLVKSSKNMGDVYHPSNFIIQTQVDDGLLLYNTFSCELIYIDNCCEDLNSIPYLRENMFVVPFGIDENKLVRQYRTLQSLLNNNSRKDVPNSYTIMTTTDCNARCFYCYEKGRSRIPMSDETAYKVSDMVIRNFKENNLEEKSDVVLRWFGGEPLYNYKVIDVICNKLVENSVPFRSKMISNGYLFNDELVFKAVNLWNLKSVQITLDGTENIYNSYKSFIYKDTNPFKRVIDNVGKLLDAGIKVTIRLNIGTHNADDLMSLVNILSNLFGNKGGFSCYAHTLFDIDTNSDESRKLVYEKFEQLTDTMNELGILSRSGLRKEIPMNYCMADSGKSLMIAPTGDIGLCDYYSENNFISQVDSDNIVDQEMVDRFKERREDIELCDKCPIYPQCICLKMCEESSVCCPEIIKQKVSKIKYAMLHEYEKYRGKLFRDDSPDFDDINC